MRIYVYILCDAERVGRLRQVLRHVKLLAHNRIWIFCILMDLATRSPTSDSGVLEKYVHFSVHEAVKHKKLKLVKGGMLDGAEMTRSRRPLQQETESPKLMMRAR